MNTKVNRLINIILSHVLYRAGTMDSICPSRSQIPPHQFGSAAPKIRHRTTMAAQLAKEAFGARLALPRLVARLLRLASGRSPCRMIGGGFSMSILQSVAHPYAFSRLGTGAGRAARISRCGGKPRGSCWSCAMPYARIEGGRIACVVIGACRIFVARA